MLLRSPACNHGVNRPIRYLTRHETTRAHTRHGTQQLPRLASAPGFKLALRALTLPRCIPASLECTIAFGEEVVAVCRIRGAHPSMIGNPAGLTQRPAGIATSLVLRTISRLIALTRFSVNGCFTSPLVPLLLIERERTKLLLKRCFLATGVDARGSTPWRIGVTALCKCKTLHAPTALDELDNNAVLIQSLSEIFPGVRRIHGRKNRWTNGIIPWCTAGNPRSRFMRGCERTEAAFERRDRAARVYP